MVGGQCSKQLPLERVNPYRTSMGQSVFVPLVPDLICSVWETGWLEEQGGNK